MKIGVLLTVYNCDKYIDAVLEPWFKLKEKYNIVIAANSGMFSDYLTLGIPFRNEKTLEKLSKWDIDFQITTKGTNLLQEDDSRNTCLNYLKKHNCDFIWYLDGDEEFTVNQIENILEFIKRNPDADYYSINFKNLTIHEHLFIDYTHERIFRTDRYNGISHYYFDNQLYYNNGMKLSDAHGLEIPKNVAYIKHYSWLSDDTRSLDKIPYQKLRYCGEDGQTPEDCRCQYEWDEENNRLEFSRSFHSCRGMEIPTLHEELTCFTQDVTIRYSRRQNAFHFEKVERDMNVHVEIYNGETQEFYYQTPLEMIRGLTYFIGILPEISFDVNPDFYNFQVKMFENNRLIHNEKLHLKLK
jgi:hypothetical protein